MKDLALITWTNTELEDVFPAYFGNLKKYFPEIQNSYVFINELSQIIDDDHFQLCNDENDFYYQRLISCLEYVKEDYFLYMQEDFILYDKVDILEFNRCFEYLKKTNFSCFRLIRSNCNQLNNKIGENIYKISEDEIPNLSFTHQPSIWKKTDFVKIINSLRPKTYRDIESDGSYDASGVMIGMGMNSLFYFDEKSSSIGGHFESKIFPYIATALTKGKWNYSEYSEKIDLICEQYNIDIKNRGYV